MKLPYFMCSIILSLTFHWNEQHQIGVVHASGSGSSRENKHQSYDLNHVTTQKDNDPNLMVTKPLNQKENLSKPRMVRKTIRRKVKVYDQLANAITEKQKEEERKKRLKKKQRQIIR